MQKDQKYTFSFSKPDLQIFPIVFISFQTLLVKFEEFSASTNIKVIRKVPHLNHFPFLNLFMYFKFFLLLKIGWNIFFFHCVNELQNISKVEINKFIHLYKVLKKYKTKTKMICNKHKFNWIITSSVNISC